MQFSVRPSELYMEFAVPGNTVRDHEYTLSGWPVRQSLCDHTQYHTLITGDITLLDSAARLRLTSALSSLLAEYFGGAARILVCGLGNREITADRLGYAVCSRLTLCGTLPGGRALYSFLPGVQSVTGIPTDRLVRMAAECTEADRILAVDALCARSAKRLSTVVQLSDTGITPGSGMSDPSMEMSSPLSSDKPDAAQPEEDPYPPEISTRTMPCPVVTAGVPTVIRTTLPDGGNTRYLVTAGNIDRTVDCWGAVLASAILRAILRPSPGNNDTLCI